jgi:hypothetical protein
MHVTVQENRSDATVRIEGRILPGFVMEQRCCRDCSTLAVFQLFRQAAFCPSCNSWLERHCNDTDCIYCADRPEHPL